MKKQIILLFLVLFAVSAPLSLGAQEKLSAAVAANFISAFKEIAVVYEEKRGIKIEATFSSTGSLYSQIKHGAPYDLFLSADEQRPALLEKEGSAEGTFVYARGQVILWASDKNFCKAAKWQDALKNPGVKKIAVANPVTAPYGAAAKAALLKAGLWDTLLGKLVNAQDIAQSFQYASTSAVDAGFCALSATLTPQGKSGCFYHILEAPNIVQAGCILKRSKNRAATAKFADFLASSEAQKIKEKFGYR